MAKSTLFSNVKFIQKLKEMGYSGTEAGFRKCLTAELKRLKTYELADRLGIHRTCVSRWLREFGIENPNKPGGNNNPGGFYGSKHNRRDINKGIIFEKEE